MTIRSFMVVLLTLLLAPSASAGGKQLTISHSENKDPFHAAAAEIISQAYSALGFAVVYKIFPAERALSSPLKKALLTGFHSTAKHNATKAVSPSSETMRTI